MHQPTIGTGEARTPPSMKRIFVFNGDADGLCALQQLQRVETPAADVLVTGPKRRTALVQEAAASSGDTVTVLDLSFDTNRDAVERLLAAGVRVRYFDHHHRGELRGHPHLDAHIDTSPDVCTSVIVDLYLGGTQRIWAVVGAFGDNLDETAVALCGKLQCTERERGELRSLGVLLNYNAYGEREEELLYPPLALHHRLLQYPDPLGFVGEDPAFEHLRTAYREDLERAASLPPAESRDDAAVYVFPDAPWARRVVGAFANKLALDFPARAHAVLVPNARGQLLVSVRAPLGRPRSASDFCRMFPGGGGRQSAAGANDLPVDQIEGFIDAFVRYFH